MLARIRLYEAPDEAKRALRAGRRRGEGDRETLARRPRGLAACSLWMFEQLDEALGTREIALALAVELGDEALAGDVLMTRALGRDVAGPTRR